jgi:endonuclease YncB( thermonuclease family)
MCRQFRWQGFALLATLTLVGLWVPFSPAGERLPGPIGAQVLRVIDGDTLEVSAHIWLGQDVATRVRLAGIDAPELQGGCRHEREMAARARAHVLARLAPAAGSPARVSLYDINLDKYGGRVLARVLTADGEDLGLSLLAAGLARPYAGRGRRSWYAGAG